MAVDLARVLALTAIPVVATIAGGAAAAFRPPSERLQSFFQHFAAGVVLAAVAGEVLPEVNKLHDSLGIIVGFSLGVLLLLSLKQWLQKLETHGSDNTQQFPTSLVVIIGVDVLIDGLLIGSSFGASERIGLLLTLALTVELLFLGLSTAAAMTRRAIPRATILMAVSAIAVCLAVGAVFGAVFLAQFTGFWLEVVLSFGAAALLYLVVEELLTEAHEVEETPILTLSFFIGFLALFMIESFLV